MNGEITEKYHIIKLLYLFSSIFSFFLRVEGVMKFCTAPYMRHAFKTYEALSNLKYEFIIYMGSSLEQRAFHIKNYIFVYKNPLQHCFYTLKYIEIKFLKKLGKNFSR